ncbi:MAG TPA: hypothetical protein VM734_35660 [Kofleriaceae bacterium]|nr:hypothetical protein [Kofleriaceae bacterium]
MSHLVRLSLVLLPIAAACGPKHATPPPSSPADATPKSEDLSAEMQKVALAGTIFRPEAIAPMNMVLVRPSKKLTVDQQRAAWKKAVKNPKLPLANRATEAQILATVLWDAGKAKPVERPALLAEAREALAALHRAAAGQLDVTSLEMAAALALAVNDRPGATPYLDELIARFPGEPAGVTARSQRAFHLLQAGDDAAAAALLTGVDLATAPAELAYVIAWSRFRARDLPGASTAIAAAIKGWTNETYRKPIVRDFLIITARAGAAPADAAATLAALPWAPATGTEADKAIALRNLRYDLTYKLSQAYGLAGRPELAAATIELALAVVGDKAQPADVVVYRLEQAEYLRRAGKITELAAAWRAARAALDQCAAACTAGDRKGFGDGLATRAVELHTVFATTGDVRYQAAAKALYELFAALPDRADAEQVGQYAADFAATTAPDTGAQYADGLVAPLSARLQEIAGCYEEILQGERALAGTLALILEIDQAGAVTGVATDPAGGDAGLAAVARCAETRARGWTLPARPRPGVARIKTIYELSPPS